MRVLRWNTDRPHRCPSCYAVAVDLERPRSTCVYTCCDCGVRFARWPFLGRVLRKAGVMCSVHRVRVPGDKRGMRRS